MVLIQILICVNYKGWRKNLLAFVVNIECRVVIALHHVLKSKFEVPSAMLFEIPIFRDTASYRLFYVHQSLIVEE